MMRCPLQVVAVIFYLFLHSVRAATSSAVTTTLAPSTCPYRTINYITHSLAQQCLASSRKASLSSTATNLSSTSPPSASFVTTSPETSYSSAHHFTSTPQSLVPTIRRTEEQTSLSPFPSETLSVPSTLESGGSGDESPLDDGKFLSFEDWKRDKLRKAGQSEYVGKDPGVESREPRKRPTGLRDSLDALGDDTEIELDFSGFVSDGLEPPTPNKPRAKEDVLDPSVDIDPSRPPKAGVRRKDAGTTYKERFNYASFDCAANVLKWNPEAKSPSAVLGENKDSYMLNECSAKNKFLILELCNDISIDTIVVSNFEFFSSTFQTFRVSVSDKYPVKIDKWKTLGTFEARNSREVQAFLVDNPVIWARYLRIEFLTHYGNEFFCPVSLVRVHGTTMLEDYKRDLEALQIDDDDRTGEDSVEPSTEDELVPDAVAEQLLTQTESSDTVVQTSEKEATVIPVASRIQVAPAYATQIPSFQGLQVAMPTSPAQRGPIFSDSILEFNALDTCGAPALQESTPTDFNKPKSTESSRKDARMTDSSGSVVGSSGLSNATSSSQSASRIKAATVSISASTSTSELSMESSSLNTSSRIAPANSTKSIVSSTQPSQPVPTMQESFFKSVQKRLQMLEANSSLSLQYIEDQSRALRDAFQKVEQRQLAKTTAFLDYLNATVLNELREFRQQYDQLWQSTVIELEMQRERYQKDNLAINTRLGVLADEIILQKRVSFLQLILIVVCLGLVLFSKGSMNSYLELPLVQSVLSRSPSTRFMNAASSDTPIQNSPVSRSNSTGAIRKRLGILKGHRRFPSEDSTENTMSPIDPYTLPTPVSFEDASSDGDLLDDSNTLGDPEFDPSLIERPSTSPPVLSAFESLATSNLDEEFGNDSIDSVLNTTPTNGVQRKPPIVIVEDATPPPKHLNWHLPED